MHASTLRLSPHQIRSNPFPLSAAGSSEASGGGETGVFRVPGVSREHYYTADLFLYHVARGRCEEIRYRSERRQQENS